LADKQRLMMQNNQTVRRRRTFFRCWWLRLFGLLLFVYGVNYSPVHLALETHLGDLPAQARSVGVEACLLSATGQAADSHHDPHLASDHSLRFASQAQVSFVSFDCCAPSAAVEICRPQLLLALLLTERHNPPGLPPPDPLQPRAPPLA
jgi:hypothetical protein